MSTPAALQRVAARQEACFELLHNLDDIGLTDPGFSEKDRLKPSFFRFSAAWKDNPQPEILRKEVAARGISASVESPPTRLLYRRAAFQTQFPTYAPSNGDCPVAEHQENPAFAL